MNANDNKINQMMQFADCLNEENHYASDKITEKARSIDERQVTKILAFLCPQISKDLSHNWSNFSDLQNYFLIEGKFKIKNVRHAVCDDAAYWSRLQLFWGVSFNILENSYSNNIPTPGNTPGIWIFEKFVFKFPPPQAKKLFKCPTIDSFQVIKNAIFPRIYSSAKSADKSKIQEKTFVALRFLLNLSQSGNLFF